MLTLRRNLKQGGYAEFLDYDFTFYSDDGTLKEDHDMNVNVKLAAGAANIMGQDGYPGPKLRKWAEEAGFVNIKEHVFKIPNGPWAKDPRLVCPISKIVLILTDNNTERNRRLEPSSSNGGNRWVDYGPVDSRAWMEA